jgi:hypothetical protein
MYNVKLFGIVTMNPPVQWIYPNKNGGKRPKIISSGENSKDENLHNEKI